jgi:hypothetical protein
MAKRVPIYSAAAEMQAEFLAQVLNSHGIAAQTAGGALTPLVGYLPATYARTRVLVDEEDVARARAIVEDFERSRKSPRPVAGPAESWVCANCGEMIEPQFTDCWKCQTPRPPVTEEEAAAKSQAAAAPPPRLPPDPHVAVDLPCVRCEYNLRNLAIEKVCPECAHPAFASLLQTMQSQQEWSLEHEPLLAPCLDYIEQRTGYPIEAIAFVTRMWRRADALARVADDVPPYDEDVAAALRDLAVGFLGDPVTASRALQRWRLASGADVARIRRILEEFQLIDAAADAG